MPTSQHLHHFWDCPVARAVVEDIELHLTAGPVPRWGNRAVAVVLREALYALLAAGPGALRPLPREGLWLLQAPPGCVQCVLDMVALATFSAIDRGRFAL